MNQNRILIRLRSHHAKLQCNFKKDKMQRPKFIPQLYKAINGRSVAQTSGIAPVLLTALTTDIEKLHGLFADLENLATPRAKSSPGLEILVQLVITCQHVHDQRILHQALIALSQLVPGSRAGIVQTITKLGRYSTVSQFLLQAARKYPVFSRVQISPVYIKAPKLPATELDSMTIDLIHSLLNGSKLKRASKSHASSPIAIEDRIRHEATLTVPVHAEVQLLFHYERNSCKVPPRIICSSKQACFLCNLFFKVDGRFIIPSTHGRLYEKWALPGTGKSTGNADSNILTTIWNFVSAVEKALLREVQSTRRPYPDPYESIILQSAVCSQSNQSTTRTRKSVSQRPIWPEDPISPPQNDAISRKDSLIPYAGKMANATANKDKTESLRSRSERSSAAIIRDPSLSNELPRFISPEETISSTVSRLLLTKGQPVWRKMSSNFHAFEVRTPQIHLTISQDEPFCNLWSQDTSHELHADSGHYWIILEYRSERSVQQGETVPIVNLLDVPCERDITVEFGSAGWPRELRVYSKDDVISIIYSLRKPVEGLDYRILVRSLPDRFKSGNGA